MCTLTSYQPVIPSVTFIDWSPSIPYYSEGSLCPTYVSVRLLGLSVRQAFRHYAWLQPFSLVDWFPFNFLAIPYVFKNINKFILNIVCKILWIFSKYFYKEKINKYLWMYFATLSKTTAPVKLPISHLSLISSVPYNTIQQNTNIINKRKIWVIYDTWLKKVNINPTKVIRYSIFRPSTSLITIN